MDNGEKILEAVPEGQKFGVVFALATKFAQQAKTPQALAELKKRYLNLFTEKKISGVELSPVVLEKIWKEAEDDVLKDGFIWPQVNPLLKKVVEEVDNTEALKAWPFRVLRASKIGDLLRFTLEKEDGTLAVMFLAVCDLYSLTKFREQYTIATGKYLDRVRPKAFEQFLSGINIEETTGTGTSVRDVLAEVLARLVGRVNVADTEEEAHDMIRLKGMSKVGNKLLFRLSKLRGEFELKQFRVERLAQCLEDLGATKLERGVWSYEPPVQ